MDANKDDEMPTAAVKPPDEEVNRTSVFRTLVSLAVFIVVDYWLFKSWFAAAILVSVIFIHESGHFIAMKLFGYRSVNMTFIPFVGAYVSGQTTNLSRINKLIVLLAGPLPGIIIGCTLFVLYQQHENLFYWQMAMPFLLLNVFNLLPVFPLDGGQFFQALFFSGSRILQVVFLGLSMLVMIYFFFNLHYSWAFLLAALLIFYRLGKLLLINSARKKLDDQGHNYAGSYDDLSDEEYYYIRAALINSSFMLKKRYSTEEQQGEEQNMIRLVESVLVQQYTGNVTGVQKLLFTLLWIAAFAAPAILWIIYGELI